MGLKKRKLLLLPATALAAGAAFAAVSLASPSHGGLKLTNVPSANTKSDGYAPAPHSGAGSTPNSTATTSPTR